MLTIYPNYYNNFAEISSSLEISAVEVGKHLYWTIGAYKIHGQVFIVIWLVMAILLSISLIGTKNLSRIPKRFQNFMEFMLEF